MRVNITLALTKTDNKNYNTTKNKLFHCAITLNCKRLLRRLLHSI